MSMIKGVISPDEMSVAKGKLLINGMLPILFTEVSGISEEIEDAELPDGTSVSGGRTKAGDFTAKVPAHHLASVRLLEEWEKQGKDPVDPDYKRTVTILFFSKSNTTLKGWNIEGVWCYKKTLPEIDLSKPADMAVIEFGFKHDGEVTPIT